MSSSADSQLGSMCECSRRASTRIGLIPEIHGRDETTLHSEHMNDLAVRKNITLKALDELMHPDANHAAIFLADRKRLNMRIELTPLPSPIGADFFFPNHLAALRSPGPTHVFRHQC